jgi:hypothetical protein
MAISAVEKRFQVVVEDNIPLYELRWPIQFESEGTAQTNDVIVLVDHWSLWERGSSGCGSLSTKAMTASGTGT